MGLPATAATVTATGADREWLAYLKREALLHKGSRIPHEEQRVLVIQAQVDEVRRRQAADELDPVLARLLAFALANYPYLLPQITRMTTGHEPDDPDFQAA
jgi:TetR/AcrR family transcriptional regulator